MYEVHLSIGNRCVFPSIPPLAVNIQAYISNLKLEGLALSSDMVYVTQVGKLGSRSPRTLLHICTATQPLLCVLSVSRISTWACMCCCEPDIGCGGRIIGMWAMSIYVAYHWPCPGP